MARPHLATLPIALLLATLAGCVAPTGTSPGPDNPQLVVYRTEDLATQLVVKGAFKDREYDRIEVLVDGAQLVEQNHSYVASEKLNTSAFNLTVRVDLLRATYVYQGDFVILPEGLKVTERPGGLGGNREETKAFPFTRILEKQDKAEANDG